MTSKPDPGSDEAIALGCTCPVLDNGRGRGYMGQPGIYVYTIGCPVHPWEDLKEGDEVLYEAEDDA